MKVQILATKRVGVILNRAKVVGTPPRGHYTVLIDGQQYHFTRDKFEVLT